MGKRKRRGDMAAESANISSGICSCCMDMHVVLKLQLPNWCQIWPRTFDFVLYER